MNLFPFVVQHAETGSPVASFRFHLSAKEFADQLNSVAPGFVVSVRNTEEKAYRLTLHGCDDYTSIDISCSPEQLMFLEELARHFMRESSYECMPTLEVEDLE